MKWILCCIIFYFSGHNAYKILLVFPVPTKSHGVLGDGYVKLLLDAGHEVTYITPYSRKNVSPKLHIIDVSANTMPDMFNITALLNKEINMVDPINITRFMNTMAETTVSNKNVQNLLSDPAQKFDVIIVEWLFSDIYCGFAAVFDCPYIWSSSMDPHSFVTTLIDETQNPAYASGFMSPNIAPFTFQQRIQELKSHVLGEIFRYHFATHERNQYEKWFGPIVMKKGKKLPLYDDVKYNASLMLGNSHPSIGQAMKLPQNYIPIAGYHISTDIKPLPLEIKKLLDNAKNGFIYFSMGSILKSRDFPDVLKNQIIEMLRDLGLTVFWKYEEDLNNLPKNIHLVKWAPQQAILSHRNCIVFITHGGLLSITEAIHFGIPMIGIPVYADQFINVNKVVNKGMAKKVDLSYTLANDLKKAIEDVLGNPVYARNAKEVSTIYHDRPVLPGKELVHWVEHVVRTKGAPHLRSPALMVPWYQKMYLDLFIPLVITLCCIVKTVTHAIEGINRKRKIKLH